VLFGNQFPVVPLTWIDDGPWLAFTRYSSPESIEIFLSTAFLPTFRQRDDSLVLEMLHLYLRHVILEGEPEDENGDLFSLCRKVKRGKRLSVLVQDRFGRNSDQPESTGKRCWADLVTVTRRGNS
jgi:hypothetical protein